MNYQPTNPTNKLISTSTRMKKEERNNNVKLVRHRHHNHNQGELQKIFKVTLNCHHLMMMWFLKQSNLLPNILEKNHQASNNSKNLHIDLDQDQTSHHKIEQEETENTPHPMHHTAPLLQESITPPAVDRLTHPEDIDPAKKNLHPDIVLRAPSHPRKKSQRSQLRMLTPLINWT